MKLDASIEVLVILYYLDFQKTYRFIYRKESNIYKHTIFIKNVVYQYKKIGPFNYSLITERGGGRGIADGQVWTHRTAEEARVRAAGLVYLMFI